MIRKVRKRHSKPEVLKAMLPLVREWFDSRFDGLTAPQAYAVPIIHARKSVLISSPTGSGKTLTAFLSIINELLDKQERGELEDRIYCVYVSPLKALANDINKNLREPLREMSELAKEKGMTAPKIRVAVRSGDTSSYERQKMARKPPHILITTPESLAIILSTPKFSQNLSGAEWLIMDEIHDICSSKRGVLLSVSLERLQSRLEGRASRIGLSATQAPIEEMAKFLVGFENGKARDVNIVEVESAKEIELSVLTPVEDMTALPFEIVNARMYQTLYETVLGNTTTLVFTNTRSGTETVMVRLSELGLEDIAAHHGSLSKETRLEVEDRLKRGELRAVVTSTSLELGIDIGSIDMVCQIGSPKSIAKGLQRIGRSGHGYGEVSRGKLIVFDNDDLVECAVLAKKASENYIDRVDLPLNSLDVLAQTIVGMSLERVWGVEEAYEVVRGAYSFHELSIEDFRSVVDYLASRDMPHVYSKIWLDEDEDVFGRKRGSRLIYYLNSGAIPEEANFKVYSDAGGRLGELSEGFVERLSQGDVFVLGGKAYEFARARGMSLYVKPATGRRPTVPSWTGEMLPRSFDLSVEIGRFRGMAIGLIGKDKDLDSWLRSEYHLDEGGARTIGSYFHEQLAFNGHVPTDDNLVLEGYVDPKGNLNVVFHYCFGRRVNDALARAYAMAVSDEHRCNVSVSVNDDCFMLTLPKRVGLEGLERLVRPDNIVPLLERALRDTELFKQRFRHCSTRGFMVLKNYKGREVPVGRQHQRSQKVLRALDDREGFPMVRETMNEIMTQTMNVPAAVKVLDDIEKGRIKVSHAGVSDVPSPFAHNIVLVGMSDIVLMHDRSALLKELHRKVLLKVGGTETLRPELDIERVRRHFEEKKDIIRAREDIAIAFIRAGPLELFSRKGNCVYDFSEVDEETLNQWCNELITDGTLVSVWAGRSLWAHGDELGSLAFLYSTGKRANGHERSIIGYLEKEGEGRTSMQISKALDIAPKQARRLLGSLERAYRVARLGLDKKGDVLWGHRKVRRVRPSKGFMRGLVSRHLGHFGPMTLDELAYELALDKDTLLPIISDIETDGVLVSGAFTEPSLQHMLADDRSRILTGDGGPALTQARLSLFLLQKHLTELKTMDGYFDMYGVVWLPQDLVRRLGIGAYDEWLERRRSGEVLHGRFLDGSVCYVRTSDVQRYVNAYRREALDDASRAVLNIIRERPGLDVGGIQKASGLPARRAKAIIERLDRNMYIVRRFVDREGWSSWNRYEALDIEYQPENAENAAREIILQQLKALSPLGLRDLARATGFSLGEVKAVIDQELDSGRLKVTRLADAGERELLVMAEESLELESEPPEDWHLRILTLYDPVVQHHRFELRRRFGDMWYYPVFKGPRPVGMLELWEMSGCVEVREIALDEPELLPELLGELDRFAGLFDRNMMDVKRVTGALGRPVGELDDKVLKMFKAKGYVPVRNWLVKGRVVQGEVSERQMVSYLLWRNRVAPERRFGSMEEGLRELMGFRSDSEAELRCRRPVRLRRLQRAGVVQVGRLIPQYLTAVLPEELALYKAALGAETDEHMRYLMNMLEEDGPLRWRQVVDRSPLGYKNTLEAKARLTNGLLALTDADNRYYLTEPTRFERGYARGKVLRSIISQFGIFSAEHLSIYTKGEFRMSEIRKTLREMEDEGVLVKGFLLDDSERLHWIVSEDLDRLFEQPMKQDIVLTMEDRLQAYLLLRAQRRTGIGSGWVAISDGEINGAASVRRRKGEVPVRRFWGSEKAWELMRARAAQMGKRLRMLEEEGSEEEHEDWYERHLRPATVTKMLK